MFLDLIIRRNPNLIYTAVELHQSGQIPANTYVIDLEGVKRNAKILNEESKRTGVRLYFMTKQFNRNPLVSAIIQHAGIPSAVAVDVQGAKALHRYGIKVGHVGHLVQIPNHEIQDILEMNPEIITVFSIEKAKRISDIASKLGKVQNLLLRVRTQGDIIYPNEEGGILRENLKKAVDQISKYRNVKISGVVTFPATLYHEESKRVVPTPNFRSIVEAASELRKLGCEITQINAPGATSAKVLQIIAEAGGTHGEPGHGLIGTTPWHLYEDLPEIPCMVYVNEISHFFNNKAYVFGGGFYACDTPPEKGLYHEFRMRTAWTPNALVGNSPENILKTKVGVEKSSFFGRTLNATDYYGGTLCPTPGQNLKMGDTVIYGFRAQVFTTRSYVAVVDGIQSNNPKLLGVFDRSNNLLDRHGYPVKYGEEKVKAMIQDLMS